jgi:hypothetical protein
MVYKPTCRLIPSNILSAFKNNKKETIVKKNENDFSSITWSVNENFNSVIKRFELRAIMEYMATKENNNFL